MGTRRTKRGVFTLVIVVASVLVGAILGTAQSVFPVRFDDSVEGLAAMSVSAVTADAFRLVPLDAPPVTCDAAHQGYVYLQNDVGSTNTTWERHVCICIATDTGGAIWWNHAISCADLMN